MKILDCTLRDGGYYTNWDFNQHLVDNYLTSLNDLPIEYLEVGYRSPKLLGYYGEYFYCPDFVLKKIAALTNKKLVIILDEKNIKLDIVEELLKPCLGIITMVRIAIDPDQLLRAIDLAKKVKSMGFEVGFNVMYMSKWKNLPDFLSNLKYVDGVADYFYMVDSYGGVYPEDVKEIYALVRSQMSTKIGFHGHNNLELALINTLTAIECGADMVDATITGMGRGAGNLKTELLLTALNHRDNLEVDFNALSSVTDAFTQLQKEYEWGTNLPYMVSGANSLPQKDVMDWVGKRYYSYNSIIRALSNQSKGLKDNETLNEYNSNEIFDKALIIGGGDSIKEHIDAIKNYLVLNPGVVLIHSSSRNVSYFNDCINKQFHCLAGNEGHRLEKVFNSVPNNRIAILPPYPRTMGTYIPQNFKLNSYQLSEINVTDKYKNSITALVLQLTKEIKVQELIFCGYDGYNGEITQHKLELFNENEYLFKNFSKNNISLKSFTPTKYKGLQQESVYSELYK
ncbi:aldolase catalytic domain-containing protein [Flavobacterium sp. MC2016-06]|jgi:4-hydroxy 2-oxovalerate aldolase|uniref:aldolase catalytic domain-containing protein n=1 Tax=Flavobacterium sp. MC2016-06 TaxID=2676308 RepID=UPI0012BB0F5A|nr:aldolase catalytic domain-containing protein [Flavobacterium sp. MC2016-06]MBU3862055.1 aldolase catalytic domain-containing protein [Flavobacterium sp. MC2016-06]